MIKSLASSHSDQLHRLQWALFPSEIDAESKVIQITASRFSEGVTSITLALATSMARLFGADSTVVVEANLRKPAFHEILGVIPQIPLISCLENIDQCFDAITKLEGYGISVLSAGSTRIEGGKGPEFYLEKLGKLLDQLKSRYKFILVDSPPVLPFIDTDIISGFVDGVVIVVEASSTPAEVLDVAINRLKSVEAPIVGLILNKRVFYIPNWLYRFI